MTESLEQYAKNVMSGEARGAGATVLRAALTLAEPFYATATRLRNAAYSRGLLPAHRLSRPVISVGNITTGGTGKTPLVIWLARQLVARDRRPAVLLRGYKSRGGQSDEHLVLQSALANLAPVVAGADRVSSGQEVDAKIDLILLDDGFQHRRLSRDFDLVLIDATNPFGFEHVLPRGLLRERLTELDRASAFVITRVDRVSLEHIAWIEQNLRAYNNGASIFHCRHVIPEVILAADDRRVVIDELCGKRVFVFCGIGNPQGFAAQLEAAGVQVAGVRTFPDHYRYRWNDPDELQVAATAAGAKMLITTEKDWVKFAPLAKVVRLPIGRATLQIEFNGGEDALLLAQIDEMLRRFMQRQSPPVASETSE